MLVVGALASLTGMPLMIAPFGATAVLIFGQPRSALAQPANVIGGYALAASIAAVLASTLPDQVWVAALGVGFSIMAMSALRVTHPPAGAVPLVIFGSHLDPLETLFVVLAGSVLLVMIAVIHHFIPPKIEYPAAIP
ncbi:HPP family protein [Rhizobium sp. NFR07]|uniref:HPP family protein n=1 Tax=Rhizobium sp. NFR07 TaxID=1566262 RepID=UPI00329A1AD6